MYGCDAAAAAKLLQSCPTLCDPIDGSPLGLPVPGILQARTLEWVAISFSNGCDSWTIKKAEHWSWAPTMVLEKTLESPLDSKEIKPVNPQGNQSWIFNGRTDAEAKTPILWPPDVKNWLIGKDTDAGKDWRQEEKGTIEDGLVGWHYWLDGHEFEQDLGVGDGQGSLVCCSPWGHKGLDMSEQLSWT